MLSYYNVLRIEKVTRKRTRVWDRSGDFGDFYFHKRLLWYRYQGKKWYTYRSDVNWIKEDARFSRIIPFLKLQFKKAYYIKRVNTNDWK